MSKGTATGLTAAEQKLFYDEQRVSRHPEAPEWDGFPSWLLYEVPVNLSGQDRLSFQHL